MSRLPAGWCLLLVSAISAGAEEIGSEQLKELEAANAAYVMAFNGGDADKLALMYATDAEYVANFGVQGIIINGRNDLKQAFADFFEASPGVQLKFTEVNAKTGLFGRPMMYGRWQATNVPDGFPTEGKFIRFFQKHDGAWRVVVDISLFPIITPPSSDEMS